MSFDYRLRLCDEMRERFGRHLSWPASAPGVVSFFLIIFENLGPVEARAFFEEARAAHRGEREAAEAGTYEFGFAHHLSVTVDDGDVWEISPRHLVAWAAMTSAHQIVRGGTPDFEQYIDAAVSVCVQAWEAAHGLVCTPAS